ncbi:MAG: beta-N-acetylhexosaminidase [Rickettsiales bacterium]|nr:beta-N-acetylhexosaminidase [Rickettsiales bacterium]
MFNSYGYIMSTPDGIICSIEGQSISKKEYSFFQKTNPLGFILFSRNYNNKIQITDLINELKNLTLNQSLLIFIDQEGGRVQRLKNSTFTKFPEQSLFGKMYKKNKEKSEKLSYLNAYLLASELKNVGVDINFSPVCDLYFNYANDIIGDRSFSSDPIIVRDLVLQYCKGYRDSGILPVMKHFPGHGRSLVDTHLEPSEVNVELDILRKNDFIPFQNLKTESLMMLAHIVYSKIDNEVATYSKKINKIIRNELFFKGLILTDDISMKALSDNLKIIIKKSYSAGCDVILHCNGKLDEVENLYEYTKKIKKKYYDYFINDILNLKLQKRNILNIKKILSSNNIIKN